MSFLAWIVLGLIAGAIAKAIMPGNDPGGLIITMVNILAGNIKSLLRHSLSNRDPCPCQ